MTNISVGISASNKITPFIILKIKGPKNANTNITQTIIKNVFKPFPSMVLSNKI
jgi:hypothetical protein